MIPFRLVAAVMLALLSGLATSAAPFSLDVAQTEIAVPTGLNHLPLRLPITHSISLTSLSASSNTAWVSPAIDSATGELVLAFATTALTTGSSTATVSLTDGTVTVQTAVRATVSPLKIVRLIDDPIRSRTYGLHQNGTNAGALVLFDPIQQAYLGCITLGQRPTDFAVKPDGTELLAICNASPTLCPVNLATLQAGPPIPLSAFGQWRTPGDTSAHVAYGSGTIVYYTDSYSAPVLRVLDRNTGSVIQTIQTCIGPGDDGTADTYGFGAIAFDSGSSALITWAQLGWSSGGALSMVNKFAANPDGTLTYASKVAASLPRDPTTTPVLTSANGSAIAVKTLVLDGSGTGILRLLPSDVVAMSPRGEIVSTTSGVYEMTTGNKLYTFPFFPSVQVITSDSARLIYFDPAAQTLRSLDLGTVAGATLLPQDIFPQAGSTVPSPVRLAWGAVAGVDNYRVYLGTDQAAVTTATPASPEYLGLAHMASFALPSALIPGTTYYWRIDAVNDTGTTAGDVHTFAVATITVSLPAITGTTVAGNQNYAASVDLTSTGPARAWTASASAPWIHLQTTGGTTPSTLAVRLDASQLPLGLNTGSITVTTATGSFALPVQLKLDALGVTLLRADPHSAKLYAISEPAALPHAYLLEIDSATEAILRAVPVGRSVTDLAIHEGDNRIYVINWADGALLAINRDTLQLARTYAFEPHPPNSYTDNDVYHVAAGGPGRLVVEANDQWVNIRLFDTAGGTVLATVSDYQGGGLYGADKRYYYHAESGTGDARMYKFDTSSGRLVAAGSSAGVSISFPRLFAMSDDGTRLFWANGMYDAGLALQWNLGAAIYAASADGRYACSDTSIYDTVQRKVAYAMPVKTQVSAFNAASHKLVVQRDAALAFYLLDPSAPLPTPVLTVSSATATSATLTWATTALATGFTLQRRVAGTAAWTDVSSSIAANLSTYTVSGLTNTDPYEFRLKANSDYLASDWSPVVTTILPPATPAFGQIRSANVGYVSFSWTVAGPYDSVAIERRATSDGPWSVIASIPAGTNSYEDAGLPAAVTYYYRLRALRGAIYSAYSSQAGVYAPPALAPVIADQPGNRTVLGGGRVQLSAIYSAFPSPTFQWRKNGVAIPGATDAILTFSQASESDSGAYDVIITNDYGTVISSAATLTVYDQRGVYFGTFADNNGSWALIIGDNGYGTFLGYLAQPNAAFFASVYAGADGQLTSSYPGGGITGGVTVTTPTTGGSSPPVTTPPTTPIIIPPDVETVSTGSGNAITNHRVGMAKLTDITLTGSISHGIVIGRIAGLDQAFSGASDTSNGATSGFAGYHYSSQVAGQNGSICAIVGRSGQAMVLVVTPDFVDVGMLSVSATGELSGTTPSGARFTGTVPSGQTDLTVSVAPVSGPTLTFQNVLPTGQRTDRLVNLASRGTSGTGNRVMILGFVIGGANSRNVLIRGVGPALAKQGVGRPMGNPMVQLFNKSSALIAQNDDWSAATNASDIAAAAKLTGAFALDAGTRDASLFMKLNPGVYSAITHDDNDTAGVALTEIYDVDGVNSTTPAITNLSIRGNVDTGDGVLIAGFVVTGNSPKRVLIRAVGPTLATVGLQASEVLANPYLRIVQDGNTLLTNDNWGDASNASEIPSISNGIGASALPANSKDAVILTTLAPGVYSAIASGVSGGTGIALVEVYQVP